MKYISILLALAWSAHASGASRVKTAWPGEKGHAFGEFRSEDDEKEITLLFVYSGTESVRIANCALWRGRDRISATQNVLIQPTEEGTIHSFTLLDGTGTGGLFTLRGDLDPSAEDGRRIFVSVAPVEGHRANPDPEITIIKNLEEVKYSPPPHPYEPCDR